MNNSRQLLNLLLTSLAANRPTTDAAGGPRPAPPAIDPTLLIMALLSAQANGERTSGGGGRKQREKEKLRRLTLRDFCRDHYLPGKNHPMEGTVAEHSRWCLNRLRDCFQRDPLVRDCTPELVDRFRGYLLQQVQARKFASATANRHLRQLRAVINYAARARIVKRLPPIDFLDEAKSNVDAWSLDDLDRLYVRAGTLEHDVSGVPAHLWWQAWASCLTGIGCRITAMMLSRREDFQRGVLLLRAENQKQDQDQRIALPRRAAMAVEALLAAHDGDLIWPWPHDPPRPNKRRKWRCLGAHFRRLLLVPCGLTLPKGVLFRQGRRTRLTLVHEFGGNSQVLAGHSSDRITARYRDRKRMPVCREALVVPETSLRQQELF